VSEEVEGRLAPFAAQLTQLDTIPGINRRTAEVLIAEIGVDMSVFPSDRHLASWAGLCPGNNESAGKRKSGTTRKGSRWLRIGLIEAAAAAVRTKDSALRARYLRVMRHRGHNKAVVAVAHAMLRAVYHLLAEGTTYREPGVDYSDRRHTVPPGAVPGSARNGNGGLARRRAHEPAARAADSEEMAAGAKATSARGVRPFRSSQAGGPGSA
jgi:transposase